jgi:hypothetical protein
MGISVRRALPSDVDWLLGQLKAFSDSQASKHPLLGEDRDYSERFLTNLIEKHLVMVADKYGIGPVGFISGLVTPHIYNPKVMCLLENFWWVDPLHRGSRAGLRLLNEFTDWGKANVDRLNVSLQRDTAIDDRHLNRRGYALDERVYTLEVS